jgi:hypothetical protein
VEEAEIWDELCDYRKQVNIYGLVVLYAGPQVRLDSWYDLIMDRDVIVGWVVLYSHHSLLTAHNHNHRADSHVDSTHSRPENSAIITIDGIIRCLLDMWFPLPSR